MTATLAPQGLVPIHHPSGQTRPKMLLNGIDPTATETIYKGSPVQLTTAGLIVPLTDATWDAAADDIIGVFDGIEYTDSDGRRRVANHWLGPTTITTPIVDMWVYVWTDEKIVYQIQANGPVAQTAVGDQFNFATGANAPDAGNNITGISTAALAATPVGAGVQGYVRCIGLDMAVDNAWGDAFTVLNVTIAAHEFIVDRPAI